jgi:hypothetical protein
MKLSLINYLEAREVMNMGGETVTLILSKDLNTKTIRTKIRPKKKSVVHKKWGRI